MEYEVWVTRLDDRAVKVYHGAVEETGRMHVEGDGPKKAADKLVRSGDLGSSVTEVALRPDGSTRHPLSCARFDVSARGPRRVDQ